MDTVINKAAPPLLSVIIPCYNSGPYLPDALESLRAYGGPVRYEVIIVDDGSTDPFTISLLQQLEQEGCTVIRQQNGGPGAARNTAVSYSAGEYLLFLDSDNKIRPSYIDKGVELLRANPQTGIVYGNPAFFGEVTETRMFATREFDMTSIFLGNHIDICSVVRRKVWDDVKGFDENRILIGYEDWDFWIMAGTKGWKFQHIKEILFDYRIRPDSLARQISDSSRTANLCQYLYAKHWEQLLISYQGLYNQDRFYQADQQSPFRSFFKFLYYKYILRKSVSISEFDKMTGRLTR